MPAPDLEPYHQSLRHNDAFEPATEPQTYRVTTTEFPATLTLTPAGDDVHYHLTIILPTLDATVKNETIPPIIQEDWFKTLESRLTNIHGVTLGTVEPPLVALDSQENTVTVEITVHATDPDTGMSDVNALITFVEGTYLSGTISGYEYTEPVASLLERARNQSTDPTTTPE